MDRNLRWLGFGAVVRASGLSLIAPYFVLYLRNVLGLGYAEIGLLAAVTGVLPLALVPFAGLITDRVGRRGLFLACLAAEAGGMLLAGYAMWTRSLPLLIGAVSVTQTMGTIGSPALSAYVADHAAGSERTLAFTWLRIGWNVGFTVGVLVGGSLVGFLGFVDVGLFAGVVLLGSTSLLALVLAPSPYDRALRAGRPLPGGPATAGRPGGVRESLSLLGRDRAFLGLCAAVALAELTIGQWGVTFPVFVNTVLHLPYALLGAGLALNGVLVVLAQAPTTRASIGHRHTSLFVLGTGLYVAGFLLLAVAGYFGLAIVVSFFAAVVVLTMGENVTSIPMTTLPSNLAPSTEVGSYNGTFFAIMGVGQLLAPTIGGFVLAVSTSPPFVWTVLVLPALPAMLLLGAVVTPRLPAAANRA